MYSHLWQCVKASRKIAEAMLHQVDNVAVQLDGINSGSALVECLQYIAASACTEHQHMCVRVRPFEHMVRQRRGKLVEIGEGLKLPIKFRQHRRPVSVHEHA